VRVNNINGFKEIWPLLLEKAYAKMHGSYLNIQGGGLDEALTDLTNGASSRYDLADNKVD